MAEQAGQWDKMVAVCVPKCEKTFEIKSKVIQVSMEIERSGIVQSDRSMICFWFVAVYILWQALK